MQNSAKYAFVAVVAIIFFGAFGSYWFFLRGDTPSRAALRTAPVTTVAGDSPLSPVGDWNIVSSDQVFVGYRVAELFGGETIKTTAVGRTNSVSGTMTITETAVTAVTLSADLTKMTSDRPQRDRVLVDSGLQTRTFPQATFQLTTPIPLGNAPALGDEVNVVALGDLTLHGVTHQVSIPMLARWNGATITVAGSTRIEFGDYDIEAPNNAFVSVEHSGEFEVQLTFVPA